MTIRPIRAEGGIRRVFGFVAHHWRRQPLLLAGIAVTIVIQTTADVLMPVFAGRLVDAIAGGGSREAAYEMALQALLALIALGVGFVVLQHLATAGIVVLTLRMMASVAQEAFWRVQRFSTDWHANNFAGSTVRKIGRGMWAFDTLNDTVLTALLSSCVVLLGATCLLGWRWPLMGVLVAAGSILYIAVTVYLSLRYVAPAARLANMWDSRIGGALADAIGCNAVVKAFGAEPREDARLAAVVAKWRTRTRRTWFRSTNHGTLQLLILVMLRSAVLGFGLYLWWHGQASPGDLTYVLATYFVVHGYLQDIGMHVRNLQRSVNDMEELVALHDAPLGVEDRPGARPIAITAGRIAFETVTFRYVGQAEPIYENFSLVIAPGERVGLVGPSGAGKTTFVKLIQRLYDVEAGRLTIDGHDVAEATQASLRAGIAIVQQEPVLFHRSLAENIAYGRPGASQAEIEQAARLAHAHEFIGRLPKGYATLVGERGVKLSGGERQRVSLARAFLANAPILVLDEATSSLDSESEALIQDAMERLMRGRTTIVIAHRLATVRRLDRILVFDRGRVVEEGSHAALLRREGGLYRRLFESQALSLTEGLELS
jgi:ATP-binding cassette subfamily B protein